CSHPGGPNGAPRPRTPSRASASTRSRGKHDMDPSLQKFGIGQPVPRSEDPVLVQGKGRYTDDINLPGQAYAWIVRSPIAHGVLTGIDAAAAREAPGVLGVWTGADLAAAGYGPLKCGAPIKNRDGSPMRKPT